MDEVDKEVFQGAFTAIVRHQPHAGASLECIAEINVSCRGWRQPHASKATRDCSPTVARRCVGIQHEADGLAGAEADGNVDAVQQPVYIARLLDLREPGSRGVQLPGCQEMKEQVVIILSLHEQARPQVRHRQRTSMSCSIATGICAPLSVTACGRARSTFWRETSEARSASFSMSDANPFRQS